MAEPTNLRRARKQRERDEKRRKGDANAAKFGVSKADREVNRAIETLAARRLDGNKREPGNG
ncbi:MAG: DUF4169 family protein [Pseudomonadota bacterium]